jgi:hypothetical protein
VFHGASVPRGKGGQADRKGGRYNDKGHVASRAAAGQAVPGLRLHHFLIVL